MTGALRPTTNTMPFRTATLPPMRLTVALISPPLSSPLTGYREDGKAQGRVSEETVFAAQSPDMQSKARTWIRRELRLFTFLHADPADPSPAAATTSSNAEFLLSYIVSILKMVDLKASNGHAENLLTEFLGRDNSKLFLHELNAWLRSPYTKLEDWDHQNQYP
ncbi:hypothetical protein PTMSG1_09181 [Pyrenophora teres f. maculata]|nr:hypothetical protein PTMSG1_09181 [Pyrenophora teres f. maculata]